jgi:hypothetical protein
MIKKGDSGLLYVLLELKVRIPLLRKKIRDTFFSPPETEDGKKVLMYKTITKKQNINGKCKRKNSVCAG